MNANIYDQAILEEKVALKKFVAKFKKNLTSTSVPNIKKPFSSRKQIRSIAYK